MLSFIRSWFLVGILGFAFPFTFEIFRALIPLTILLMFSVIMLYHGPVNRQMLFATDMPYDNMFGERVYQETIAGIEQMDSSAEEKRMIYEDNARTLFRLPV